MEFALLGPLEVRRRGEVVQVRRGRPRAVLLSLLVSGPSAVPADVIIERCWGDDVPADPVNALHVQVSYLRKTLELPASGPAPALRTVSGGYLLDLDAAAVDAHRFESAVAAAGDRLAGGTREDVEAALEDLRAALALWRGEPLHDVMYQPFFAAEAVRLHEVRASAREHEIEALLRLGQHDQVISIVSALITDHPLRERYRVQQMLALYRAGRQADALRAYDAAREHLVEELGIEPGAELQRIHRQVLDHDEALGAPAEATPVATTVGLTPEHAPPRLPASTSRLVGRQEEIAELDDLVSRNRVVTLTGPGGAGKTRLALAVAHSQGAQRPVWLVELAQVTDPADVANELAAAVGLATLTDPVDALAARLADRPGLLVLDTCEHVLDASTALATHLLRMCPAVGILATSRQALGIAGEVLWTVPPLRLPTPGAAMDDLRASEAVQLFAERARAVRRDFAVDASNAEQVAAVCRVLDGLPLAIELAAARTRVLSVSSILARLDDRFSLLTARSPGDSRQRSLRTAIEWSHELLDDDQRTYFARLGVFAGRFTYDAASAVAADGLTTDPLELLTALVDRSLVVTDGDDSYRMLDSLRAFAAERLATAEDEQRETSARLAHWLADRFAMADERLRSADQAAALAELRAEMPNLRAALEWSISGADVTLGVELAARLSWFWALEGASAEAARWLQRALASPGAEGVSRARLLEAAGIHALVLGDVRAAERALQEAVALWSDAGDRQRGVLSVVYRGVTERWQGRIDEAAASQDEAVSLARQAGDDWALAWALVWQAQTAMAQGSIGRAASMLDEAREMAARVGDDRVLARVIHELGCLALREGDAMRALDLATSAAAAHQSTGPNAGLAASVTVVGRALVALGRPEEAIDHHRRALRIATELAHAHLTRDALEASADALAAVGRPELAAEALGSASAVRARTGVDVAATFGGRSAEGLAASLRDALGADDFDAAFHQGERRAPGELVSVLTPSA